MRLINRQLKTDAEQDAKLLALRELGQFRCDRCGERQALPVAPVPDMVADRYQDLCFDCWEELIKIEARQDV